MTKSPRQIIDGCIASFLLAALMNLSIVVAAPTTNKITTVVDASATKSLASDEEQPSAKGLDHDGVPFVLRSDGTKARYIHVNPKFVKLQLSKNGIDSGNVEFRFKSGGSFSAKYAPAKGKALSAVTEVSTSSDNNRKKLARLTVQYGKERIVLQGDENLASKAVPAATLKRLESLSADIRNDSHLVALFNSVRFFAKKSMLEFAMPYFMVAGSCGWDAASCVASLVEYGLGWALIIELCGITVGAGCILALFWHPVAGALVVKHCSDAIQSCEILSS